MPNLKACKMCGCPTLPNPPSNIYKKRSSKNKDYCEDCYNEIVEGNVI